jgi:hypothetical protein
MEKEPEAPALILKKSGTCLLILKVESTNETENFENVSDIFFLEKKTVNFSHDHADELTITNGCEGQYRYRYHIRSNIMGLQS